MGQIQIAEVGEFDLNDWDAVDVDNLDLDGLDQVWPEYDGMYGLDDVGCPSCMAGFDGPPGPGGGFPWGTVLVGVGGLGLGILGAVLVKKYLLR